MTPPTSRLIAPALLLTVAALAALPLAGCAGQRQAAEPAPAARWVRWSTPVFASINREALFSLAHSPDRSTLVFEQTQEAGQWLPRPRVWLISTPDTQAMFKPIEVGTQAQSQAWLVTHTSADVTEAFPAQGVISVLGSDSGSLTAQLNLTSRIAPGTAGYYGPAEITIDARVEFTRTTPHTPQPARPATTSGVAPPEKKKK